MDFIPYMNDNEDVLHIIKTRGNVIPTDYILSETEDLKFSDMTEKEKQAYEAFKCFHQHYINSGGKPTKLSDIIHCIMDKANPPVPHEMIEQAMPRGISTLQLPGPQPTTMVQQHHRVTTSLITSEHLPTVK